MGNQIVSKLFSVI